MWGLEGVCRASSLVWTGPEKREGGDRVWEREKGMLGGDFLSW